MTNRDPVTAPAGGTGLAFLLLTLGAVQAVTALQATVVRTLLSERA